MLASFILITLLGFSVYNFITTHRIRIEIQSNDVVLLWKTEEHNKFSGEYYSLTHRVILWKIHKS